jgi:AcrR family transcriptional regulator
VTAESTLTARQQLGEESRNRILDAAEDLVADRGFAATSISRIVRASGLPASSIYWHFNSKEALLGAVVERAARRWLQERPRWSDFGGDLHAFLAAVGQGVDERPAFLRLLMQLVLERHESSPAVARETVQVVWHDVRTGLGRVFAEHYGRGVDRDRLARFAMAAIDGAFIDGHLDPEGSDVPAVVADLAVALDALALQQGATPALVAGPDTKQESP